MTLVELLELVRKVRAAQRYYYKLHPQQDRARKLEALIDSKQLEKKLDDALQQIGERGEKLQADGYV